MSRNKLDCFWQLTGNYDINGYNFQWTDGVFGMSLSPRDANGKRTLYFHCMSGITEFSVPTDVLQDDTQRKSGVYNNFHIVGTKGPLTQGPSSIIDPRTNIDYFTQVNRNGIACWDTTMELNPETFSEYCMIKLLITCIYEYDYIYTYINLLQYINFLSDFPICQVANKILIKDFIKLTYLLLADNIDHLSSGCV